MNLFLDLLRIGIFLGLGVFSVSSTIIGHPVKSGVAQVESDLAAVRSNFTQYDTNLHSFFQQGEPLDQGLALHNLAETAFAALNSTIADVATIGVISTTDVSTIEKSVVSIEATLIDICQTIRDNIDGASPTAALAARTLVIPIASAFRASTTGTATFSRPIAPLPIIPFRPKDSRAIDVPSPIALLRTDLVNFQTAFDELLNALQAVVPTKVAKEFATLKTQFDSKCPSTL